ncbi:hypothetical protein NLJ89_g11677 [Agrocybe chaxingu]|uniref:DUF914-domain-containing protein n=1 Tax=Agrocybe chaxingu TaxID=84603 RepID=A0A9W8JLG6_9AGAR|nr:hypothetical protein NLJ89_g11677 [Agrocybe chaxingu]
MDAPVRPLSARGPGVVALHYLHERHDYGTRESRVEAVDYAGIFLVLFTVSRIHTLHDIPIRIQGMGESDPQRRVEIICAPDFILAACDVEANFMVIKAYQYTDLLSCMLLDAWAIPVCLFFSWLYMRTKYHWTQILVRLLLLLLYFDSLSMANSRTRAGTTVSRGKGDAFMIAGATLYGFTNATEEFLVRKRPLYEVVGQLGMWGFLINGVQSSALEWRAMKEAPWGGDIIGLLMAFTCAMLFLYTLAPMLYRLASSAYFNLSLLSSDFYGLLFGLFLYHYSPYWLYFVSFVFIIGGLITYFWHSTPEEQGILDPQAPAYVEKRGDVGLGAGTPTDEEQAVVPVLPRVGLESQNATKD